ncbi:hypothetical protein FHW37_107140 [Neorhizobium alkalisoli]|uniref:Uncharacterized protein n=1 Tax=Neorhizobium alkalisoli TaxID=528178 RepID=A0A561QHA7_9HYPH|nr:hypothetical protein FHW37_107140 [Neorhizobium alkalisoli]
MRLEFIALLPCVAMIASALLVRRGIATWMSLIGVGVSLAFAMSELQPGVVRSCQINESECVGAKAISYLVIALWMPFLIGIVGRVIVVNRAKR